jgi:NADH-quinone oxidoreductase subunit J
MIDALLARLDTLLLYFFVAGALTGAVFMLVVRQPMRVATALIATMVFLGGIYGLLGVHFIAAFQVLIYVGAVMVFMVYVIMLLDTGDPGAGRRFSRFLAPGLVGALLLFAALVFMLGTDLPPGTVALTAGPYGISEFSATFLSEYWLHFELTSVLLLVAVVAAVALIKVNRGDRG